MRIEWRHLCVNVYFWGSWFDLTLHHSHCFSLSFYHLWFLQRRKTRVKEGTRRSRLSFSRAKTPDLDNARTSENLSTPPQSGPLSPQRPHLIPIPLSISPPLKSSYRSPPELTPVSPTILQQPSPSPSLKLDDLTVQTNPVSQSWLQSSLAPVSPIKTPESDFPPYPNGQTDLHPTPAKQLDPEGGIKDHGLPPLEWVTCSMLCSPWQNIEFPKELAWTFSVCFNAPRDWKRMICRYTTAFQVFADCWSCFICNSYFIM